MTGKLFPVKRAEILVPFVPLQEADEQIQLFALVFRHVIDKLAYILAAASLVIESQDLGQPPACGRIGGFTMDGTGFLQTVIFLYAALIVAFVPLRIKNILVSIPVFLRVNASFL